MPGKRSDREPPTEPYEPETPTEQQEALRWALKQALKQPRRTSTNYIPPGVANNSTAPVDSGPNMTGLTDSAQYSHAHTESEPKFGVQTELLFKLWTIVVRMLTGDAQPPLQLKLFRIYGIISADTQYILCSPVDLTSNKSINCQVKVDGKWKNSRFRFQIPGNQPAYTTLTGGMFSLAGSPIAASPWCVKSYKGEGAGGSKQRNSYSAGSVGLLQPGVLQQHQGRMPRGLNTPWLWLPPKTVFLINDREFVLSVWACVQVTNFTFKPLVWRLHGHYVDTQQGMHTLEIRGVKYDHPLTHITVGDVDLYCWYRRQQSRHFPVKKCAFEKPETLALYPLLETITALLFSLMLITHSACRLLNNPNPSMKLEQEHYVVYPKLLGYLTPADALKPLLCETLTLDNNDKLLRVYWTFFRTYGAQQLQYTPLKNATELHKLGNAALQTILKELDLTTPAEIDEFLNGLCEEVTAVTGVVLDPLEYSHVVHRDLAFKDPETGKKVLLNQIFRDWLDKLEEEHDRLFDPNHPAAQPPPRGDVADSYSDSDDY